MQKVLITGRRGFAGNALAEYLNTSGEFEVVGQNDEQRIDLTDAAAVKALPKVDVIVHLASKNFIPESFTDPALYYSNNINSTVNCLEKARKDSSRFIFFSTYVYGSPQYLPINELHPKKALNPYTQSKLICEELCESYHRDFGVPIVVFRPFNIYGPGQGKLFFIPTILSQIHQPLIQLNDSRPKRDFIYIEDVITGIVKAMEQKPVGFNVFNLGSGVSTSVKDVVNLIQEIAKSKTEVKFSDNARQGEILDTVADIRKAGQDLNWQPAFTLKTGLKKTIDSYFK